MRFKFQFLIIFLLLLSSQAWAVRDTVIWSLNQNFPSTVLPGRTYTVTYTFTSQLPTTMVKPLVINKNATPASDFSYTDNCSGQLLASSQSCTVKISLTPSTTGTKSVQLSLSGYDDNTLLFPLVTTASSGSQIQSVTGYPTTGFSTSGTAGVSQNYVFTFTNNGSSALTNTSINMTQTSGTPSYTTTCVTAPPGANGGTCTVSGSYTPTSTPSTQTVTAQLNYNQGSSVSTSTSMNVSSNTGVVASFVGTEYLPQVMNAGTSSIGILFTNYGPNAVYFGATPTSMTVTVGSSVGTLSNISSSCINSLPAPNPTAAACSVTGTFTASTPGADTPVTVATTLNYGASSGGPYSSTSTLDTSTVVALNTLTAARNVSIVNNCTFPVWWSLSGANLKTSCNSNTDCVNQGTGTTCSTQSGPPAGTCFWTNYAPANGSGSTTGTNPSIYKLDAAGGAVTSNTVTIQASTSSSTLTWSGVISASLLCSGTSCTIAPCGNNGGLQGCKVGQGFGAPGIPATQAEFTMLKSTSDSYDVEVINGFHIPISIQPTLPLTTPVNATPNNYFCGTPGDNVATNGFGACDWTTAVVPTQYGSNYPGNGYYMVTPGGTACNITTGLTTGGSSCSTGTVCGLDTSYNEVCGNFLGYRTADQVCGDGANSLYPSTSNIPTYFQCNTNLYSLNSTLFTNGPDTLSSLMLCAVPTGDVNSLYNTCYNPYSGVPNSQGSNQIPCCGCMDWWTLGIGANDTASSCTQAGQSTPQTDPVWNTYVQYGVQWLKKACPSVYVYPFDDKTSGFGCTDSTISGTNSVGYTVTFCPGNSGLPSSVAGLVDGR